ncbi:DUF2971 domain-containing protein [Microvirga sp. 2TAF3]|uniref:DUF2971 domain-containing protein n=1 Tax=Microvirga sp. 2TAF3 TaxID=3233014 RepID=UPI003F99E045
MKPFSHYTTEQGLRGISHSQALWATEFISVNDRTEFIYAFSAIYEAMLGNVLDRVPHDLRDMTKGKSDVSEIVFNFKNQMRKQAEVEDGYGSLYVASFARGRNDEEDQRGILTLWTRYTKDKGYCLQFYREQIEETIEREKRRYSYAWLEIAEVVYGIDKSDSEFRYLVEQFTLRMLLWIGQDRRDSRVLPDPDLIDVDSIFLTRLTRFCAKHKDSSFSDEREIRIFACPARVSGFNFLTGLTALKTINHREDERGKHRYLILNQGIGSGLTPHRIIIGPAAPLSAPAIQELYPQTALIVKSDIPIC